jgi:hypothetical protein
LGAGALLADSICTSSITAQLYWQRIAAIPADAMNDVGAPYKAIRWLAAVAGGQPELTLSLAICWLDRSPSAQNVEML